MTTARLALSSTFALIAEGDVEERHAAIAAEHRPDAASRTSRPELAPDQAEVTQCLSISDESTHGSTDFHPLRRRARRHVTPVRRVMCTRYEHNGGLRAALQLRRSAEIDGPSRRRRPTSAAGQAGAGIPERSATGPLLRT